MPVSSNVFASLPRAERFHVAARYFSAPLEALVAHVPRGKVADIGCGHGALLNLLSQAGGRDLWGVDPDARKIAWAQASVGKLAGVHLVESDTEGLLAQHAGTFDAVCVVDVLYLFPKTAWAHVLRTVHALLKPGGVLVLKEAEDDGGWKSAKCVWQERVMVQLLRRTHGTGAIVLATRASTQALLSENGFSVQHVESLAKGYTTPHVLFVASRTA